MYRSGWRRLSVLSCSSTSRSDMTCFRLFKILLKVYLALRKTGDLLIVWWSLYHPGEKKKKFWVELCFIRLTRHLIFHVLLDVFRKEKKKNHMLIISVKWNKDTGLLHMDLWLLCKNYWFLLYFFLSIRRHNLLHGLSNIYEGFGSKTW